MKKKGVASMPTADQARTLSKRKATELKEKKKKEAAQRKAQRRLHIEAKREQYFNELRESVLHSIKYACDKGETKAEHTLYSERHPVGLYGADKILNQYEYGKEIRKVMMLLKSRKFKVAIDALPVSHDDSVAYINSGGECGSMSSHYTYDTVLKISW